MRDNEPVSSREVATDLDLEVHNARTLLAKYTRFGLLSRYNPWGRRGHPFKYTLTEKGERHLMWLLGIFQKPTPELNLVEKSIVYPATTRRYVLYPKIEVST